MKAEDVKTFPTYKAATTHLDSIVEAGYLYKHKGGYSTAVRVYILDRGEYNPPDYKPVRYRDGWGILKKTYYRPGTHNAPPPKKRVQVYIKPNFRGFPYLACEHVN